MVSVLEFEANSLHSTRSSAEVTSGNYVDQQHALGIVDREGIIFASLRRQYGLRIKTLNKGNIRAMRFWFSRFFRV